MTFADCVAQYYSFEVPGNCTITYSIIPLPCECHTEVREQKIITKELRVLDFCLSVNVGINICYTYKAKLVYSLKI